MIGVEVIQGESMKKSFSDGAKCPLYQVGVHQIRILPSESTSEVFGRKIDMRKEGLNCRRLELPY